MERAEEIYNKHFEEMVGANNLDEYSEADVNRVLNRLLKCLPNDGKFYKYRKSGGQDFDYAYDALKNGYIWLAQASTLNDDVDTTINFDPEKDIEDVKQYLRTHPIEVLNWIFKKSKESGENLFRDNKLNNDMFGKALACYDLETGKLHKSKAINALSNYGYSVSIINKFLNEMDDFIRNFMVTNEDVLKQIADNYLSINKKFRDMAYIFSLSECYDSDAMWAYYADNKGFCIEYDFKKVMDLPIKAKQLFMSFYKVLYSDKKGRCSFLLDIKYYLGGYKDKDLLVESNRKMITQLITKQEKWKDEREWRLFLCNVENKLFADIVSAICVDKSMCNSDNGQKLLALAKERKWRVYIRKLNYIGTEHTYEQLKEQDNG